MIEQLAVANYRSLLDFQADTAPLTVITGANGCGKSNLYRSLRLLAGVVSGQLIPILAEEGGLDSVMWAGPETLTKAMQRGDVAIQGGPRKKTVRMKLGFATEEFSYSLSLGFPIPGVSYFNFDPEIKYEAIWAGSAYRPASCLVERKGPLVRVRDGRSWSVKFQHMPGSDSILNCLADPDGLPEAFYLRQQISQWRFYDHFRTDREAPARHARVGTRTPVLSHDGSDLVAALQTIREVGDAQALDEAIADAFPGSSFTIAADEAGRFSLHLQFEGLLRSLSQAELSDGTLRYLLLAAALLTPRPPPLMVLNEPETSLHPQLIGPLARLILRAAADTQLWVVTHSQNLVEQLCGAEEVSLLQLEKNLGATAIVDAGSDLWRNWRWPDA